MGRDIKAGIPHAIKVNTRADQMGYASSFQMVTFDEATKLPTVVANPFVELEVEIVATSTTLVGDHVVQSNSKLPQVITVASAAGFTNGLAVKIAGVYYKIIAVNAGENKITLKTGLKQAAAAGAAVELSGKTGTYAVDVTFAVAGKHTIQVSNPEIEMEFEPTSVIVVNANIDDVKDALTAAQSDITAIKAVTDILQTSELNNINEQITVAANALNDLAIASTSVDAQDGIISLKELLIQIKDGGVNVTSLVNGQADIKAIVLGNEFLADGVTPNPAFGKGLDEIFDSVANTLTTLNTAIGNAVSTINASIESAKVSVEAKIGEMKLVVDANKALLENGTFGLSAIKTAVDSIAAMFADGGIAELRFDSIDNALSVLTSALAAQTVHIDSKFDEVLTRLSEMDNKATYHVFA